jgi:hypothetical protein
MVLVTPAQPPQIIHRDTWDRAQDIAPERGNIQDLEMITTRRGRYYVMKSRIRCRICQRRMTGTTRTPPATRNADTYAYYHCPHSPKNPRHAAADPDHPNVTVREDILMTILKDEFFGKRVFGPDRATLRTELGRIDNAQARLIEQIGNDPNPADPAIKAYHDWKPPHHPPTTRSSWTTCPSSPACSPTPPRS